MEEKQLILKRNDEKRIVTGLVLVPEKYDAQLEIISAEEIEKAAYDYMLRSRNIDTMHQTNAPIYVVESYVAPCDLTIEGTPVIKGSWVLSVFITDDVLWEKVKKGDYRGFSVLGLANKTPVEG